MTPRDPKSPETLTDLLRTLERSQDLRPLARECGLTVRELRRRLSGWRRDLKAESADQKAGRRAKETAGRTSRAAAKAATFPELPDAAELSRSPLPARGNRVLEVFSDGASRGNPGPAAIGILFRQQGGPDLCAHGAAIGRATNNVAEYSAALKALELCHGWGIARVHLFLDSELIARQLTGAYRVKSQDLLPLYQQLQQLIRELREFRVQHVPRGQNAHADHLANVALDAAARASGGR